jgi:hypothetical protein
VDCKSQIEDDGSAVDLNIYYGLVWSGLNSSMFRDIDSIRKDIGVLKSMESRQFNSRVFAIIRGEGSRFRYVVIFCSLGQILSCFIILIDWVSVATAALSSWPLRSAVTPWLFRRAAFGRKDPS